MIFSKLEMGGGKPQSPIKKQRDSQMELLRIIAMSMILIHHFVSHGSKYNFMEDGLGFQNSFVFYGVNLFVLISGYYGIKVRWRSFLSLIVTIFFFVLVDYVLKCGVAWYNRGFDLSVFNGMGRILLHPYESYWFISCYIILYMLAPILNIGLKNATRVQLRSIVLIFACYCIYGGLIFDYTIKTGYEMPQFILLYITGYWIRAERPFASLPTWLLGVIPILCSIINGSGLLQRILGPHSGIAYSISYINLFCYIGAVSIFLLFTRFSFYSRLVNSLAGASLGCYLLQEGQVGNEYVYVLQKEFEILHPLIESLLMYAGCFMAIWLASWVLTWFKNLWAPRLIDAIYRWLPQRFKQEVW